MGQQRWGFTPSPFIVADSTGEPVELRGWASEVIQSITQKILFVKFDWVFFAVSASARFGHFTKVGFYGCFENLKIAFANPNLTIQMEV